MEGCLAASLFLLGIVGFLAYFPLRRLKRLESRVVELDSELMRVRSELGRLRAAGGVLPAEGPVAEAAAEPLRPVVGVAPPEVEGPPPAKPREPEPAAATVTAGAAATEAPAVDEEPAEEQAAVETPPAPVSAGPSPAVTRRRPSFEELLGTQVFLRAGVAIVVLGVVFFLGYALKVIGPLGRVALGYLVAAAMLAGGLTFERRERFVTFGRALVAGAWAILYFVTYAMHFVPAARILDSTPLAAIFLFAAAGGAVTFSLRYRNEWATTASFLLIFLALGVAALTLDTSFNLLATVVVAAGLALLAWWRTWDRLLAAGAAATWLVLSLWLIPYLDAAATPLQDAPLLIAVLLLTWSLLQAAALFPRAASAQASRLHALTSVAGLWAAGLALACARAGTANGGSISPDGAVALIFGLLYLASAWHLGRQAAARPDRRPLYLLSATIGLLLIALALPLQAGAASGWPRFLWLLETEMVLAAGVYLRERYFRSLAYAAFAAIALEQVVATELASTYASAVIVVALANVGLLRTRWRSALAAPALTPEGHPPSTRVATAPMPEFPSAAYFFSGVASVLLLLLAWQECPAPWLASVLAAAALAWIGLACAFHLRDFLWEGSAGVLFAVAALATETLPADPAGPSFATRFLPLAATAAALYAIYVLIRRRSGDGRLFPTAWRPGFAGCYSLPALAALAALVLREAGDPWQAPVLLALVVVHFALAFRLRWAELLFEGLFLTLLGTLLLWLRSWQVEERILGLPGRTVSVLAGVVFLWIAQHQLWRQAHRRSEGFRGPVSTWLRDRDWRFLTALYLTLPTAFFAGLVKAEALASGKNLLVALAWGLMGVLYLEVARLRTSRLWFLHGHALLAAATVHLFLVNFVQSGALAAVSLRVWTVVPFLLLLAWVYRTWTGTAAGLGLSERTRDWRHGYLYGMVAVLAALLLYELDRSWVVAAWAALALTLLVPWQLLDDRHWRLAATGMAIATALRGLGSNLYLRDEVLDLRVNLLSVPLACLLLLAAYALIRRRELRAPRTPPDAALGPKNRLAWLTSLFVLVTGFVLVEASGTALTVWLSVEGLAAVALGFVARERIARLAGLALLSFCVLKLVIYDLRGLGGLARIFSFIVLGLVLIAVSYAYTRYKDRWKELL